REPARGRAATARPVHRRAPERGTGRVDRGRVTHRRDYLNIPREWERIATKRVGGFITSETFRRPDGAIVTWDSRAHRKHGRGRRSGSTWWAPRALAWGVGGGA